jgi:outer membrane protein assembly factor BamB/regulation of enolase protein 1 (concanavalin A-like superfamily)
MKPKQKLRWIDRLKNSKYMNGVKTAWVVMAALAIAAGLSVGYARAATDEWSTSLHDISRTGASSDTSFAGAQASQLTKKWSLSTGAPIASQPAIVGGVAYVGSWNGYEYALNVQTGAVIWKTNLGITNGEADCDPPTAGVSSAATVSGGVVYVGGGDSNWYALNATTGAVEWSIPTGDNSAAGGHYNWSSPLLYNGFAYVGIASLGDCPLVQGQLLKVNLSTHAVVATLNLVPDGSVGGGIWTSPAYDPATNKIYAVTGTETSDAETYAQAILAIDATSMSVVDYWHLPEADAVADSDWTTSTLLFNDSNNNQLVLATNKNGEAYAFNRANLAAGPVWQQNVAIGNDCAACGYSTVSSATIGQNMIFQAGGNTQLTDGKGYAGSVQAWNPATGAVIWQHPESGPVIGAITYMNGMVIAGGSSALEVLDAATGHRLYSYDTGPGDWIYAAPAVGEGTIITGNTAGTIYAFSMPATTPPAPPADPNCPTNFTCQDVGSPTPTGSETVASGVWSMKAGGTGMAGTEDSFRLATEPTAGDAQITAQLKSQSGGAAGSQVGLMLRQNNDPGSAYYGVFVNSGGGLSVQYRNTPATAATLANTVNLGVLPQYLEIQRVGDTLTAAVSTNGVNYTLVPGTTETVIMPYSSMAGLAEASGANGTTMTAGIGNVTIGGITNTPVNTASTGTCPASWSCGDIGDPLDIGGQSVSGGNWSVQGTGGGIDGRQDQLHYIWQPTAGDATISTDVTAQSNTNVAAKAGLMMRADTTAGSAYYGAFVTPSDGIQIQYRGAYNLPMTTITSTNGGAPQYLEISRSGTTFTTYTSPDGVTWTPVVGGTLDIAGMTGGLLTGVAVTSADANATSNVTVTAPTLTNSAAAAPTVCPTSWTCSDIGGPIPEGSQYLINGTWSLLGGGKDIWGAKDEFRYVAQSLAGDGTIAAKIAGQDNTDPWAKGGLMMRATTDPGSPYYAILTTPGNGTVIQYRTTQGDATTQLSGVTGTAPIYAKIVRSGTTFTAYISPDGDTWTEFPGSSIQIAGMTGGIQSGMADTSHSQFTTNTTVFSNVNLSDVASSLPAPWADTDIGGATPAGSASYANGVYTINGGGNDIWGTLDQQHYVSQTLSGNGSIVARVTSQTNTDPWAKSGVEIKQSTTAGSNYALLAATPGNGLTFQYDYNGSVGGGSYTFPNAWLKLTRAGNTITAYSSATGNGNSWVQVGTTTVTLNDPITVGMFVTSHNAGQLNTSTFDNVSVTNGSSTLPSPWTDTDIGGATPVGSAGYANGVYTINGGGNDIWGTLDQQHYVSQTLSGNGTIVARVTSQTNTDPWAKSGVEIKQSTAAGSNYALLAVTPGNGLTFQYDYNGSVGGGNYTFPNGWVKLSRVGNTITAYSSADGTTWTAVGTTTVTLSDPVTIGMFVTSHNSGQLNTSTFDNVSVTTTNASALPTPWADTDIGGATPGGSASFAGGVYTINGGGNDIWGTLDQQHYVYQPWTGNGTIIARVTAQSDTDSWAKSGIEIKQSTTAGSNYALLAVTPGNGVTFQYDYNGSVAGGTYTFPNGWLKLTRVGSTITAYASANGTTWTQVGTTTVTLTDPITLGMFVTSHNAGALNTSTFDNVSVTSP